MELSEYLQLRAEITQRGYGDDIAWSESVGAPGSAELFAQEHAFVVCNSGMRAQIASTIYRKVMGALLDGQHPSTVFGHKGKSEAMWAVWQNRADWFSRYWAADDKVAFLGSLPWIGDITKWHLAKNFGVDAVKPDRHLVRVAARYETDPTTLCARLARASGDRIGTVDTVIWRACNLGIITLNNSN
ncbi:hypothetical protein [Burkholderia sp. Tr-20390]|uniref:hypothetical protein n=1 Tax=Burkholderia sp. Tr-20390 TaxID=2703904 RepID=UPI00198001D9|nr:hypothetical protein [Burkholderia sp. Tr-20390]MBN3729439.1 hypothetical protein [Burkholderia sp. Tr-20390]